MKKSLTISIIIVLFQSVALSQTFEGKLTYLFKHGNNLDTNFVFVRGDSIRIDLDKRNNVSTYLYFPGKNTYHFYSKRDQAYFSHPIIKPDANKQVISYKLNSKPDSIILYHEYKTLSSAVEMTVETTTKAVLALNPNLLVSVLKDIYVEPCVLNGSGYIAEEINIEYHFSGINEKRTNQRRLIHVDYIRPGIQLFDVK